MPVAKATWSTVLRTTGTVDWDNDRTTQAITQVSGPITRILVDTGARVKKGDVLLYVSSPDVSNAISAYRKARNRARSRAAQPRSQQGPARAQGASRSATSSRRRPTTTTPPPTYRPSLEALRIFGVTAQDLTEAERQNVGIRPELAMRAPISGTIVQKMVLPGQLIQAGTTAAFVISDVSTLWVQGHIYEKDLPFVHTGDTVEMRNASFPVVFHGTVSYIGDMIDPATRTTPVRIVTPNSDNLLKKDLFLDVTIQDKSQRDVLVVPTTSVLYDDQNFPFVYLQVPSGGSRSARSRWARSSRTRSRSPTASSEATAWSRRAASSCSSPTARRDRPAMINRIVAAALSQRFVVLIAMVGLAIWGVISFQRLPIDAYPDLAPPRVQIVTQWPGPRRRGSRAPDHHPARDRDERHPEAGRAALDLALRPVVGDDELRLRHRSRTSRAPRRSSASPTPKCPTA